MNAPIWGERHDEVAIDDVAASLVRLYDARRLRELLARMEPAEGGVSDGEDSAEATSAQRRLADRTIRVLQAATPDQVGRILSFEDHNSLFPLVAYYQFDSASWGPGGVRAALLQSLNARYGLVEGGFLGVRNGITAARERSASLESIRVKEGLVSLVFSQSRHILEPYGTARPPVEARVPAVVRIDFDKGVLEVNLPFFAEVKPDTFARPRFPERGLKVVRSVIRSLKEILPGKIVTVDPENLVRYLEARRGAVDMGWDIERLGGGDFRLRQALLPLRDILGEFADGVASECKALGIDNLLGGVDLYALFRALREGSHTSCMALKVPVGPRGGTCKLSILFERKRTSLGALFHITATREPQLALSVLRRMVAESTKEKLKPVYSIEGVFKTAEKKTD